MSGSLEDAAGLSGSRFKSPSAERPGLLAGNDEETSTYSDGVFEESDDKIRDFKSLHEASAPLIAGKSSRNSACSSEDGAERGSLSSRYADASA